MFELRQYAALLDAHQLPLALDADHAEAGPGYLLETLAPVDPAGSTPALHAHEAPGLGVVAITLAQHDANGATRVLAHGYPLHPQGRAALIQHLADHYAIAPDLHALGRVAMDEGGQLSM